MAIDFPNSPTIGQTFTVGARTWTWNGVRWNLTTYGTQGPQGTQGNQGVTGSQGPKGDQGNQGTQGNQGNTGSQGPQGNQGSQGSQGVTGSQGSQGPQGSKGDQGFQGNQGFQGTQGNQGFQGNQGVQGRFITSDTAPLSPSVGDVWFNSSTGNTFVWYDSYWVAWGQGANGQGVVAGGSTGQALIKNSATDYDTIWAQPSPWTFKSGYYYYPPSRPADTTYSPVQSLIYLIPFPVGSPATFDRIGIEIVTGVATSVVRLGIYNDSGRVPGTLLLDAGTVDSSTNGAKEITINQTLSVGLYWLAAVMQVATGVVWRARADTIISIPQSSIGNANITGFGTAATVTGALPSSLPSPSPYQPANPKIYLRVA